jgi:hypothetical protein
MTGREQGQSKRKEWLRRKKNSRGKKRMNVEGKDPGIL